MAKILGRAGIPKNILDELHNVVDTCSICRAWARPQNEAISSVALPTEFNAQVECDLMFYKTYIIINMLCRTTRWHASKVIADRTQEEIVSAVDSIWVAHH